MKNIFTEHPHSVGETYLEHFYFASQFGCNMLIAGFACLIHAIFPFMFQTTGSRYLLKMTQFFVERMPTLDESVTHLGDTIQAKKKDQFQANDAK